MAERRDRERLAAAWAAVLDGRSNGALARRLDVAPATVSRWARGTRVANIDFIKKALDAVGASLAVRVELWAASGVPADVLRTP